MNEISQKNVQLAKKKLLLPNRFIHSHFKIAFFLHAHDFVDLLYSKPMDINIDLCNLPFSY